MVAQWLNLIGTFVWFPISCSLTCCPSFCFLRPCCPGFLLYGPRRAQVRPACDAMVHGQGWKRRLLPHDQYSGHPDLFALVQFGIECCSIAISWQSCSRPIWWCFSMRFGFKDLSKKRGASLLQSMAVGVGNTQQKLDLVVKRLHHLGAPKVGVLHAYFWPSHEWFMIYIICQNPGFNWSTYCNK